MTSIHSETVFSFPNYSFGFVGMLMVVVVGTRDRRRVILERRLPND